MSVRKECIGKVLKAARLRRKLTAEMVAEMCNVSRSRVFMWEAESYVFEKNLRTLAAVLRLSEKRLREINGKPPRV